MPRREFPTTPEPLVTDSATIRNYSTPAIREVGRQAREEARAGTTFPRILERSKSLGDTGNRRRHRTGSSNLSDVAPDAPVAEAPKTPAASSQPIPRQPILPGTYRMQKLKRKGLRPPAPGPATRLNETLRGDRTTTSKIYDKLFFSCKTRAIRDVFRKFDVDRDGTVSPAELKAGMKYFNFGLTEHEFSRLMKTLDADESAAIDYEEMMRMFDGLRPLGGPTPDRIEDNIATAMPWEPLHGKFRAWNSTGAVPEFSFHADKCEPASYEEISMDMRILTLINDKFMQRSDRLRHIFRKLDVDKNAVVDRNEFVQGVQKLNMGIPEEQIGRFFDIVDDDHSGVIDYEEFMNRFDSVEPTPIKYTPKAVAPTESQTLRARMQITPREVQSIIRKPLVTNLLEKMMVTHKDRPSDVFRAYDANGDGRMSLKEMRTCLSKLCPGLNERDVATLMVAADPNGDGYLDYNEFVGYLDSQRLSHPRAASAESTATNAHRFRMRDGDSPLFRDSGPRPGSVPINEAQTSKQREKMLLAHSMLVDPVIDSLTTTLGDGPTPGPKTPRTPPPFGKGKVASIFGRFASTPEWKNTFGNTQPKADTAMWASMDTTFKRKHETNPLDFQAADRARKAALRSSQALKWQKSDSYVTNRKANDEHLVAGLEKAKMSSLAHQNRRYTERMAMYNVAYQQHSDPQCASVFDRTEF